MWIWSWKKSRGQLSDLVDSVTRHMQWAILCQKEAKNMSLMIKCGHCVYIAAAPAHARSVAIIVRADILPLVSRVVYGERYMYIDFGFTTAEAKISTMRVGSCHLPTDGGHHTVEEFSSILPSLEEHALQRGGRTVQVWGFEANMQLGRRLSNAAVGRRLEDL